MFNATETAVQNLRSYLEANNMQMGFRIKCRLGKNAKPGLSLGLGGPKENDLTFDIEGVRFIVNKTLLEKSGGITLDYIGSGPQIGYSLSPLNTANLCAH